MAKWKCIGYLKALCTSDLNKNGTKLHVDMCTSNIAHKLSNSWLLGRKVLAPRCTFGENKYIKMFGRCTEIKPHAMYRMCNLPSPETKPIKTDIVYYKNTFRHKYRTHNVFCCRVKSTYSYLTQFLQDRSISNSGWFFIFNPVTARLVYQ